MPVTKDDLQVIAASDLITFSNGDGNRVDADLVNQNFSTYLGFLQTVTQYCIDSTVETSGVTTYTSNQIFQAGIQVDTITAATATNGDIVLVPTGTGSVYKTSVLPGNELQTKDQVDLAIATLTGTNFDLIDGGVQTTDFAALSTHLYYVSGSAQTVRATLPLTPVDGDIIGFINYLQDFEPNDRFFEIVSTSHDVQGAPSTGVDPEQLSTFYALYLRYDSALGWYRL